MPTKGFSLHIGLNAVNPNHYSGWSGELMGCENDAQLYKDLAQEAGFSSVKLMLTKEATYSQVLGSLKEYSKELNKGDLLLLTYAGHGGTIPDINKDEDDGYDETWCLFDRQLVDDELFNSLKDFKEGVRILIISDSCHSGTVSRNPVITTDQLTLNWNGQPETHSLLSRQPPREISIRTYERNAALYNPILEQPKVYPDEVAGFIMLFAACQDNQTAKEWGEHGLFTATFKKVFNGSLKNYDSLFKEILKEIPNIQTPNLYVYGNRQYDFSKDLPFSIAGAPFRKDIDTKEKKKSRKGSEKSIIVHAKDKSIVTANRSATPEILQDEGSAIDFGVKEFAVEEKAWDIAYKEYFNSSREKESIIFVEPNVESQMYDPEDLNAMASRSTGNDYMPTWPQPKKTEREFIWHLDDDFSQLRKANDAVMQKLGDNAGIRIGHIDTGYLEHVSNPVKLMRDLGVSFVKEEKGVNKGQDKLKSGYPAEQDGHGLATMAILAGNKITIQDSYAEYEGYFGAIPFAEVVPIRICETVYNFFNANDVADGIDYAVDNGCEVITMSMAGYPTRRVAEAVNRAYEKGVVIVTAAGNNFVKGLMKLTPKSVMYPARFDRVTAATGACYNNEPYDLSVNSWYKNRSEGGQFMQGNWGPARPMKHAVAGYTPNLPWATTRSDLKFLRSGGGTSSATPQVAAAFALWIAYNREKLIKHGINNSWQKVEAARKAIFRSASKAYPDYKKYYGNGIIRAFDALDNFNFDTEIPSLKKSEEAKVNFGGFFQFSGQWFRSRASEDPTFETFINDRSLEEMVELEIVQLLYRDPELFAYCEAIEFENEDGTDFLHDPAARKAFFDKIRESDYASEFLKSIVA